MCILRVVLLATQLVPCFQTPDDVRSSSTKFSRVIFRRSASLAPSACSIRTVALIGPPIFVQRLHEAVKLSLPFQIVRKPIHQHAAAPHTALRLRARS